MTDRPIIFSAPMVRALLAGTKTQTRRILNPQPISEDLASEHLEDRELRGWEVIADGDQWATIKRLPYAPGDRLYVREAHSFPAVWLDDPSKVHFGQVFYPATADAPAPSPYLRERGADHTRLRPSIHMPRWASRLTLTVTEVRVQRLQEISEDDALAEGVGRLTVSTPKLGQSITAIEGYRDLWNSLHGPEAWDANPWVVAVSFTVRKGNIDG